MARNANEMKLDTEGFLKRAFCVDGQCNLVKTGRVDGLISMMFKLTDSKRGTFFVTISK